MPRSLCETAFLLMASLSETLNSKPFSLTSLFTAAFAASTVVALSIESSRHCNPDLQLWLGIMAAYVVVRWSLRSIIEAISLDYLTCTVNAASIYKMIEMVDLFGIVWFSVGALLVFNGTQCAASARTPCTFWVSLVVLVAACTAVLISLVIRLLYTSRELAVTQHFSNEQISQGAGMMSADSWKSWLGTYGCAELTYAELKADSVMEAGAGDAEKGGDRACPICLLDFEAATVVVSYPCSARTHYFHASCMFDWLKVSGHRGLGNITCPCCREAPSMPGAARRRSLPSLLEVYLTAAQADRLSSVHPSRSNSISPALPPPLSMSSGSPQPAQSLLDGNV